MRPQECGLDLERSGGTDEQQRRMPSTCGSSATVWMRAELRSKVNNKTWPMKCVIKGNDRPILLATVLQRLNRFFIFYFKFCTMEEQSTPQEQSPLQSLPYWKNKIIQLN